MRKLLIVFLLMLAVAAGGFAQTKKKLTRVKKKSIPAKVKTAPAQGTNNMNGETTLELKQQAVDSASGIKIEFVAVLEDSRCPEGVNCIWAGNGRVQISVSKNGANGQTIELNTNLQPRSVSYQGYTIALTDLAPYPKDGVDPGKEKVRAGFTITKE